VIADDSIKIEVLLSFPPATSPPHPQAMKVITEFAKADGGAPVVAPLTRGFTDCRFFREKSIPCFGFIPLRRGASDEGLVHGVDERIAIANLRTAVRAMYQIVRRLAAE
jgi:acetylornithine deacetylase/succinyl-diaminopimelate desuccinylase-like protein